MTSTGCGRALGPFACCTVVEGDSLELTAMLQAGDVEAIVTDPPYGQSYRGSPDHERLAVTRNNPTYNPKAFKPGRQTVRGDTAAFDPTPFLRFPRVLFTGAHHFYDRLPAGGGLHVWDKRGEYRKLDQGDADIIWDSRYQPPRTLYCVWRGLCRHVEHHDRILHPTQKPVELMAWMLELAGRPFSVLDPYAGSGSTLVAAARLGLHFLGFEAEADYCAVARERLSHERPRLYPAEVTRIDTAQQTVLL